MSGARRSSWLVTGEPIEFLRRLEAMLLVGDSTSLLVVSGNGDVIEPDDGIAAIGSGGAYALAAARALVNHSSLGPAELAREALEIAAEHLHLHQRLDPCGDTSVKQIRTFTPREIVSELDRYIVGQTRGEARRGDRTAEPLAKATGPGRTCATRLRRRTSS